MWSAIFLWHFPSDWLVMLIIYLIIGHLHIIFKRWKGVGGRGFQLWSSHKEDREHGQGCCTVTYGSYTCRKHGIGYREVGSLCRTPETNVIQYVSSVWMKKKPSDSKVVSSNLQITHCVLHLSSPLPLPKLLLSLSFGGKYPRSF